MDDLSTVRAWLICVTAYLILTYGDPCLLNALVDLITMNCG